MSGPVPLRPFPIHESDAAAERFVDKADLSDYDLSGFRPARAKVSASTQLSMELSQPLLAAVNDRARERGISAAQYVCELIERDVASKDSTSSL